VPVVLVNPGRPVETRSVFRGLARRENAPMPDPPEGFATAADLVDWLGATRNDLETPAMAVEPAIGRVLAALSGRPGCALARMSGSGATCFGLFPEAADAEAAALDLSRAEPEWWVASGTLAGGWQGFR
jgi:4-diphosphocytidyl-2-C-methyl-D-erythritol kinase